MENHYDYIIAGAGCAGLSLAYKMIQNPWFNDKKILVLDKDTKQLNDRTWCHWSATTDDFESIVHKKWNKIIVANNAHRLERDINPYAYKMIRGIDFYNFVIPKLKAHKNLDFIHEKIVETSDYEKIAYVQTTQKKYTANFVFNSFRDFNAKPKDHFVLQHFKGWFIKSKSNDLTPETIHFMDFRTPQKSETRFFYVLPTSESEALVQLAIFSNEILSSEAYDFLIKEYLDLHFSHLDYSIEAEEIGVIPMTTFDFSVDKKSKIIPIGTAGGNVKPSSGFAYERIQNHTDQIIKYLTSGTNPQLAQDIFKRRHKFLDKIFLNAILTNKTQGEKVFIDMFNKLEPQEIFKFLNEETSFIEELKIFTAPPTLPFVKAFLEEI